MSAKRYHTHEGYYEGVAFVYNSGAFEPARRSPFFDRDVPAMHQTRFPEPRQREILTVSDVVERLRWLVEREFRDVWIGGEVTNLQVSRAGHCYFTLKDAEAQIRAVCFRMQFQYLRFKPENGSEVRVRGGVSVYTARGDLQVIVDIVEPAGRGSLQAAFEKLKARLEQEGLFGAETKQRIPLLPSRVGIITSSSGAALHDLLRALKRRNDQVDLLIAPVQVQGRSAAIEISEAIRVLNQKPDLDVLIVARGGGSIEDLWAFNEEIVARAIFHSRIPVISAVGHETDFTICDFVADVRAATPSAAAEIVSAARQDLAQRNDDLANRLRTGIYLLLERKRGQLQRTISSPHFVSARERVHRWSGQLQQLRARLLGSLPGRLPLLRKHLDQVDQALALRAEFYLSAQRKTIESLERQLGAYSPLAVLHRGYAIVSRLDGQIVRDPQVLQRDERLRVRVESGEFGVRRE